MRAYFPANSQVKRRKILFLNFCLFEASHTNGMLASQKDNVTSQNTLTFYKLRLSYISV